MMISNYNNNIDIWFDMDYKCFDTTMKYIRIELNMGFQKMQLRNLIVLDSMFVQNAASSLSFYIILSKRKINIV